MIYNTRTVVARHAVPSSFAVPSLEVLFLLPFPVGRRAGDEGLEDELSKLNPYKKSNNPSEGSENLRKEKEKISPRRGLAIFYIFYIYKYATPTEFVNLLRNFARGHGMPCPYTLGLIDEQVLPHTNRHRTENSK